MHVVNKSKLAKSLIDGRVERAGTWTVPGKLLALFGVGLTRRAAGFERW